MAMTIRLAEEGDLPALRALYKKAVAHLHGLGIPQWTDSYPVEMLPEDIDRQELFVLVDEGDIRGALALNTRMDSWLMPIEFTSGQAHYVHRLAVDPHFLGRGYAKLLMLWAQGFARGAGSQWMRLDTNEKNQGAIGLYERLGYVPKGQLTEYNSIYIAFECRL